MRRLGWKLALAIAALILAALVLWPRRVSERAAEAARVVPAKTSGAAPIALTPAALAHNALTTTKVARARLAADVLVVGSVAVDPDRYALVGPLVAGRVARLRASVGDVVRVGQVLADVESAEVGQAQAAYLAAGARAHAADANAQRERDLAAQHISSAREQEVADAAAVSETAEVRAATERLRAFGLLPADIERLRGGEGTGGRIPLRAPIAGTVVARTVTLGQAVERATDAFKIVDLSRLWVLLDLHEKDVERVHVGQMVELRAEALGPDVLQARVAYVSPLVDEAMRTTHVRIQLDNRQGHLRPGQFVTARLVGDPTHTRNEVLAVSRRAVQTVDGKALLFRKRPGGFERLPVELGASAGDLVEVRSGAVAGDEVAADGAFLLKSELLR
jgi:cobalt-zinc-cadmium efflux system membrane fusion protein